MKVHGHELKLWITEGVEYWRCAKCGIITFRSGEKGCWVISADYDSYTASLVAYSKQKPLGPEGHQSLKSMSCADSIIQGIIE